MIDCASFIHFFVIASITVLPGLGVGIGQGITSINAFNALDRQPRAKDDIRRANILALALVETAALLSLLLALLLFFTPRANINYYSALASVGIGCALALPGLVIGIVSSLPARAGLLSIARQPFLSKKITNLILLTQSLIQTPLILGFVVSWLIKAQLDSVTTLGQALTLLASGLCIGIGSLGPSIGGGLFTQSSCKNVGLNRTLYGKILSFTVISQAIIETPILFAAVISFWLLSLANQPLTLTAGILHLSIAALMSIATCAPGISSGLIARTACNQIAINPLQYNTISRTSLFSQAFIDTCIIYAFIIALLLIVLPK
jgi:F-type H+-transporting ATPase subunit c